MLEYSERCWTAQVSCENQMMKHKAYKMKRRHWKTLLLKFIVSAKHEIHTSFTEICLKPGMDLFQSITWIQCCFFLQVNWKETQRIFNSLKIVLQYYDTPATAIHVCGRYGWEICGVQFTGWLPNVYTVTSAPIFHNLQLLLFKETKCLLWPN